MISYHVGDGLGNIIETTPSFNYLVDKYGSDNISIMCSKGEHDKVSMVYKDVKTPTDRINGKIINSISISGYTGNLSEIEANLNKVGCPSRLYKNYKTGFCGFNEYTPKQNYDILICDGYQKQTVHGDAWKVKSYKNYVPLVKELTKKYTVASIGLSSEYIDGTHNETGIGLGNTLGLLKNSKLLICNDTGMYHASCVFGVKTLVIFTMTDTNKNYDKEFHKNAKIIRKNIDCQPCQLNSPFYWVMNRKKCKWECNDFPINAIIESI